MHILCGGDDGLVPVESKLLKYNYIKPEARIRPCFTGGTISFAPYLHQMTGKCV